MINQSLVEQLVQRSSSKTVALRDSVPVGMDDCKDAVIIAAGPIQVNHLLLAQKDPYEIIIVDGDLRITIRRPGRGWPVEKIARLAEAMQGYLCACVDRNTSGITQDWRFEFIDHASNLLRLRIETNRLDK